MEKRKAYPSKVLSWIIALCGLWEFGDIAAPFIPGFGNVPNYLWNHIIVGLILMVAGAWAALTSHVSTAKRMNWIAAAAGVWLIIASLILRNPNFIFGLLNDIIVGVIVFILGIWAALSLPQAAD